MHASTLIEALRKKTCRGRIADSTLQSNHLRMENIRLKEEVYD